MNNVLNEPGLDWRNAFHLLMQRIDRFEDRLIARESKIEQIRNDIERKMNIFGRFIDENAMWVRHENRMNDNEYITTTRYDPLKVIMYTPEESFLEIIQYDEYCNENTI